MKPEFTYENNLCSSGSWVYISLLRSTNIDPDTDTYTRHDNSNKQGHGHDGGHDKNYVYILGQILNVIDMNIPPGNNQN